MEVGHARDHLLEVGVDLALGQITFLDSGVKVTVAIGQMSD